jgi:hypothetical protein
MEALMAEAPDLFDPTKLTQPIPTVEVSRIILIRSGMPQI